MAEQPRYCGALYGVAMLLGAIAVGVGLAVIVTAALEWAGVP